MAIVQLVYSMGDGENLITTIRVDSDRPDLLDDMTRRAVDAHANHVADVFAIVREGYDPDDDMDIEHYGTEPITVDQMNEWLEGDV